MLNDRNVSIIMILLGLFALLFPVVSTQTIGVFTAIIVLLVGIGLLIAGIFAFPISYLYGIFSIIFAFACFFFSYQLMFNPELVSGLVSFIIYLVGFILIVLGLLAVFNSALSDFNLLGINTLLFGIITIIVGVFVNNPAVLGTIIGIWLIVSGLLSLFGNKKENVGNKDYIDV